MFKGHPKGLYALALANTGERFGYYTMLAIFVLFLQAKFGYNEAQAGNIYGIFLGCVYFMPLIGGMLADRFGYGKMVKSGIVVMFLGYLLLAVPMATATAKVTMFSALALIAIGTGLFKGNLQVMVGNLYDEAKYSAFRDNGFSLFYMAINIGSMFAPITATKVTDLFLGKAGFSYVPQIPSLAHQYLDGTITPDALSKFEALAVQQGGDITNLAGFANNYIDALSGAYNYGFGVACLSLILSMAIYLSCRKWFQHADVNAKQAKTMEHTTVLLDVVPAGWPLPDLLRPRLHAKLGDRLYPHRLQYLVADANCHLGIHAVRHFPVGDEAQQNDLRYCYRVALGGCHRLISRYARPD